MEDNLNILKNTPSLSEDDLKNITNIISEYNKKTEKDNDTSYSTTTIDDKENLSSNTATEENALEENNRLASFLENTSENKPEECTALVTVKERRIMAAQTMFKRSIKVTIKSFLISLSLSFLNFFI